LDFAASTPNVELPEVIVLALFVRLLMIMSADFDEHVLNFLDLAVIAVGANVPGDPFMVADGFAAVEVADAVANDAPVVGDVGLAEAGSTVIPKAVMPRKEEIASRLVSRDTFMMHPPIGTPGAPASASDECRSNRSTI
jgi:hypothetical protein